MNVSSGRQRRHARFNKSFPGDTQRLAFYRDWNPQKLTCPLNLGQPTQERAQCMWSVMSSV